MKYLIAPIMFLFSVSIASACSLAPEADRFQSVSSNLFKYETVFLGKVIEVSKLDDFQGQTFVFEVSRTLKGEKESVRKITSPGHSCGSFFSVGQIGLFFLGEDATQIDESNPRYLYSSFEQADQEIAGIRIVENGKSVLIDPGVEFPEITSPSENPPGETQACTREYRPVCGNIPVQCIQAPCPPVQETFSNRCVMETQEGSFLYEGECQVQKPLVSELESDKGVNSRPIIPEGTVIGPETSPFDGFVEPLGPPPFDNSPQEEVVDVKKVSFFEKIRIFTRGLFSWFF